MADQLSWPRSEMTAAPFQSHRDRVLLAKEKQKNEGEQENGTSGWSWELVNTNLSRIYSTKQS